MNRFAERFELLHSRRLFLRTLPATALTLPFVRPAPAAPAVVPTDPLYEAACRLGTALDRRAGYEDARQKFEAAAVHDKSAMLQSIRETLDRECITPWDAEIDAAEAALLDLLRARGKAGVIFQGRLYADQAQAIGASLDRWRCSTTVVELAEVQA